MKQIAYYQFIFLFLISIICYIFFNVKGLASAILGGSCYLLPTLISMFILFCLNKIIRSSFLVMYIEFLKILLSVLFMFFILFFSKSFINSISFLLGFFSVSNSALFFFRKT